MLNILKPGRKYIVDDKVVTFVRFNDNEYSAGETAFFKYSNGSSVAWDTSSLKVSIVKGISAQDYRDICSDGSNLHYANKDTLRLGQAYFNYLNRNFSALADLVRGSEIDPFYRDDRVLAFLSFIISYIEEDI